MLKMDIEIPEKFQIDIEKAVEVLKKEGCEEIYIFGSLVNGDFSEDSDIDIAIKGLSPNKFFKVIGKLLGELNIRFDLVDLEDKSRFSQRILEKERLIRIA